MTSIEGLTSPGEDLTFPLVPFLAGTFFAAVFRVVFAVFLAAMTRKFRRQPSNQDANSSGIPATGDCQRA